MGLVPWNWPHPAAVAKERGFGRRLRRPRAATPLLLEQNPENGTGFPKTSCVSKTLAAVDPIRSARAPVRPDRGPWRARGRQRAYDDGWERRMLNGLRTIAHAFNQKIG